MKFNISAASFSPAHFAAAVAALLVSYGSSAVIIFQAAQAFGATDAQITSWFTIIGLVCGVLWCLCGVLPLPELAALVAPFVEQAGLGTLPQEKLEPLCVMFRERANNLKALGEAFRPLVVPAAELSYVEKDTAKHFTETGKAHLKALAEVFAACEPFTAEALEAALNAYVADNGLKFKEVAPPLRTALMGFMGGSHLNEIMAFLGKQETLARLQRAMG